MNGMVRVHRARPPAAAGSGAWRTGIRPAFVIGLLVLSAGGSGLRAGPQGSGPRPNVLLITVDTLRADKLGCYGNRNVKTPHIDGLARNGILFTRVFAHNPLTLPSHANIMTGLTPLFHGVHDNENFVLQDRFLTLAEFFKARGYATGAVIGAFPLDSRFGMAQGFDFYEDNVIPKGAPKNAPGERRAEAVARVAEQWLDRQESEWFLWVHFYDPHYPYEAPEPFSSRYPVKPYNGEVAYVDSVLGDFLTYLETRGRRDGTVIILTSDHGESLGDHGEKTHGMLAYNSTLWIPLIISGPGLKPATSDRLGAHIDIFPTLCDLLGQDAPPGLQGVSLVPGGRTKRNPSRLVYFESLDPYDNFGWAPLRGFISAKSKFIDSPVPELYDLESDFTETVNLSGDDPPGPLRKQLNQLMKTLSGPGAEEARRPVDRQARERLRSLGYLGPSGVERKTAFGPRDDIKALLPVFNRSRAAYVLKDAGQAERGIAELRRIIAGGVRIFHPYLYLAELLRDGGRLQEALDVLSKGVGLFPANYELVRVLADCLVEAGRNQEAVELVRSKSLFQMEQDPRIWFFLGRAYENLEDFPAAVEAYEKTVGTDPEFAEAYFRLGVAYSGLAGRRQEDETPFAKGVAALRRSLELDPGLTESHRALGLAYFSSGETAEAVRELETCLSRGFADGRIHFILGQAYLSRGDRSKALASFTACKTGFPGSLTDEEKRFLDILITRCAPGRKKGPG